VVDHSISSITVQWTCPEINPTLHSEITEYFVECLPVGLSAEEELTLTPVPCTPALPPINPSRSQALLDVRPQIDYIYQKYLDVTVTSVMFSNLMPCAEYSLRAKCCSMSGWSRFSPSITQCTKAYVPEPPDPVDVIKVSSNGLLLAWRKPYRDNGQKVDHYQIELIDAKMGVAVMHEEFLQSGKLAVFATSSKNPSPAAPSSVSFSAEALSASTQGSGSSGTKKQNLHTKRLPLAEGSSKMQPGVASRFHRLIKHKNLNYLFK